jgi:small-conductance mechanosensitive channel
MGPRFQDFGELLGALVRPGALVELGVLVGCLALAWLVVRLLRGATPPLHSIWFGERGVDGVLFPVVALLLALLARWLLHDHLPNALFRLVVPILVSLVVIRLVVRVLHGAFPRSMAMRVVERSVSWIAWGAVILWVTGVLPLLLGELEQIHWRFGGAQVSVRDILEGVLSAVVVLTLALWVSAALEQRLLRGAADNLGIRKMAANLLRALLLFVGLLLALSAAGIDLTALGVLGGALGVGIGLGLQRLAANYVSGFVILAENSMRIGDLVRVDNFEGRITDITTRYTVIQAPTGRESIVPNEMMVTQRVENASLADTKMLLTTVVQVAYGTDLDALMPRLRDAVAAVPRVLADPAPGCNLTQFAADGLELTIGFWIRDPENGLFNVRSEVNLAILRLLGRMGVEIPFPQRVMHTPPAALSASSPAPAPGPAPASDPAAPRDREG